MTDDLREKLGITGVGPGDKVHICFACSHALRSIAFHKAEDWDDSHAPRPFYGLFTDPDPQAELFMYLNRTKQMLFESDGKESDFIQRLQFEYMQDYRKGQLVNLTSAQSPAVPYSSKDLADCSIYGSAPNTNTHYSRYWDSMLQAMRMMYDFPVKNESILLSLGNFWLQEEIATIAGFMEKEANVSTHGCGFAMLAGQPTDGHTEEELKLAWSLAQVISEQPIFSVLANSEKSRLHESLIKVIMTASEARKHSTNAPKSDDDWWPSDLKGEDNAQ